MPSASLQAGLKKNAIWSSILSKTIHPSIPKDWGIENNFVLKISGYIVSNILDMDITGSP